METTGQSTPRTLAALLRTARLARRWSAPELARRARVNHTTIYRIEDGSTRWPEEATVRRLAAALELPWRLIVEVAPYLQSMSGAEEVAAPAGGFQPGAAMSVLSSSGSAQLSRYADAPTDPHRPRRPRARRRVTLSPEGRQLLQHIRRLEQRLAALEAKLVGTSALNLP